MPVGLEASSEGAGGFNGRTGQGGVRTGGGIGSGVPKATPGSRWMASCCALLVMGVRGTELGTPEADCCPHMGFLLDLGGQGLLSFPVWKALMPLPHTLPSPVLQTEGRVESGGSTVTCPPRPKANQRPTRGVKWGQVEVAAPDLALGGEVDVPTPVGSFPGSGSRPGHAGFRDGFLGTGSDRCFYNGSNTSNSAGGGGPTQCRPPDSCNISEGDWGRVKVVPSCTSCWRMKGAAVGQPPGTHAQTSS